MPPQLTARLRRRVLSCDGAGNRRQEIFHDDDDRRLWLSTLAQACERTGWRVHAWVLLSNHYHLFLETPEPNLVVGMQWLQNTYTRRFNTRPESRRPGIRRGLTMAFLKMGLIRMTAMVETKWKRKNEVVFGINSNTPKRTRLLARESL